MSKSAINTHFFCQCIKYVPGCISASCTNCGLLPKEEPKQRLEKYSERFDNKNNEVVGGIFNPETWGERLVEEPINTPEHYNNDKGTLYKVANERGWNAYLFEVVKRIERAEKKGEFISDIKKSIVVLELYLQEQGDKFKGELEILNKK